MGGRNFGNDLWPEESDESIHKRFTWTCTECGHDVDCGLMNWVDHKCGPYAPNESIATHWHDVKEKQRQAVDDMVWLPVEAKLNASERFDWDRLCSAGMPMGYDDKGVMVVGYGSDIMREINLFKGKMIQKYRYSSREFQNIVEGNFENE